MSEIFYDGFVSNKWMFWINVVGAITMVHQNEQSYVIKHFPGLGWSLACLVFVSLLCMK